MVLEQGKGTEVIGSKLEKGFDPIYKRAHSFDGYAHLGGSMERVTEHVMQIRAAWVANRAENYSLQDLRTALFLEARSIHFDGYPPSKRLFYYMRDLDRMIAKQISIPPDQVDIYRARDLSAEGIWPESSMLIRYGSVAFDGFGKVMLRHPTNDFDGYVWTFAKGRADENEHPLDAALRIAQTETGIGTWNFEVIGHLSEAFGGTGTGSWNCYYLLRCVSPSPPGPLGAHTRDVHWFSLHEARRAIGQSTNEAGQKRDLKILEAAGGAYAQLTRPVADGE